MKVALVVPGGVDRGGAERVIPCLLALIERLARLHDVHVFALHQEARACSYPLLGATVHCPGPGGVPRALLAVLREHRRGRFQLVHVMFGGAGRVGALAAVMLRLPLLMHLAGGELVGLPDIAYGGWLRRRSRWSLGWALRRAARITAPSQAIADRAHALGFPAQVVTYGVDSELWPAEEPRPRGRGTARLLFVASLNRVKDPETLLRAAEVLRDRGVDYRLDVVGGDTRDGAVQRLAAELALGERVIFHGFLTQRELRPWMLAAHLLLVTSRHEAGPVVALEAAACGVPTVGTPVGHLADWAPDAAVLVPFRDPVALADAVMELLDDEERRIAVARAAQARTSACDADQGAERVAALYREMVG